MKLVTTVFILTSFLYSSQIPWDLTLVLLITRSLVLNEKSNYFLAFWFGLLNSYLLNQPLGLLSLTYLLIVFLITSLKRSHLTFNWLNFLLSSAVFVGLQQILKIATGQSLFLQEVIIQLLLVLPVYFLILLWEERFVVQDEARLKL